MDSQEEKLRKILRNEKSFETPEGYFEELPGKVMDNINSIPDFEKPSVNPFGVPENYFEKLSSDISDKISSNARHGFAWRRLFKRLAIPLTCLLLIAGIYFFSTKKTEEPEQLITIDDISPELLQSIDESVLVDVLYNGTEKESTDSLIQYLIDNNIELSEITNAL